MTEHEWLACRDPDEALRALARRWPQHHGRHRKLRLFASACCRLRADRMADPAWAAAFETAERFADRTATRRQAVVAFNRAVVPNAFPWACVGSSMDAALRSMSLLGLGRRPPASPLAGFLKRFSVAVASLAGRLGAQRAVGLPDADSRVAVWGLLVDIFGNPVQPAVIDPSWRTSPVRGLAGGIYDDRAFDRLPILADALQDAGCDAETILTHCRSDGPHVRGCWVIDAILGKA